MRITRYLLLVSLVVTAITGGIGAGAVAAPPGGPSYPGLAKPVGTPTSVSAAGFGYWNNKLRLCMDSPNLGAPRATEPVTVFGCNLSGDDNQRWYTSLTRVIAGVPLYQIRNAKGDLCLDAPDYGRPPVGALISTFHCHNEPGLDNQEWWFMESHIAGAYYIRNAKSDLCLDVAGNSTGRPDTRLTLFGCLPDDDHLWKLLA